MLHPPIVVYTENMTDDPHNETIDMLRLGAEIADLKQGQRDIQNELDSLRKQLHAMPVKSRRSLIRSNAR